ncbi:MAG: ABC transporter permease [Geodermatophilaceae bacterium]
MTTPPARRPVVGRVDFSNPTHSVYAALAAILVSGSILVALQGGVYLDSAGVLSILSDSTALGLVAIGQTIVILCRSLDLSVALLIGLCSLVAAEIMDGRTSMVVPAIVATLAVAALVGLANGLIITKLRVNAFIATLGMALILRGLLEARYTGPAGDTPLSFQQVGYTRIGPIPVSALIVLALAAATWWYLTQSRAGYHVYAVGGSPEIARLSGVRTDRTIISAHVLCSLAAGITGLYFAARLDSGSPFVGTDGAYDLQSIAAVVLGGTLLAGGRGGIVGTIGGVLILASLDTLFDDLGVNPFFKDVVRGVVIIVAVAIYARRAVDPRRRVERSPAEAGAAP